MKREGSKNRFQIDTKQKYETETQIDSVLVSTSTSQP